MEPRRSLVIPTEEVTITLHKDNISDDDETIKV